MLLAQSPTRYFYDDTNQLFRALDTTGTLLEYVYDPVGNPTQILRSTVAPGSIAILNFTPRQSGPGATITIYGQNFSAIAANDIVMFNGIAAIVVTATATELTVTVPTGATSGVVTVTVNGQTANSGTLQYAALPPPTITSLIPDGGITGTSLNLTIAGTNLDAATFTTSPAGALSINATGTSLSANGLANISGSPGPYAVVATTAAGNSSSTLTPANRFIVMDTFGEADSFTITILNRAAPPAGTPDPTAVSNETTTPTVTVLNTKAPPAGTPDPTAVSNEASSETVSVLNTKAPPAGTPDPSVVSNESDSPVVTVLNPSGSSSAHTLVPAAAATPTGYSMIHVAGSDASSRLVSGKTATLGAQVPPGFTGEARFYINGVLFETLRAAPFETVFTVPAGLDALNLNVEMRDSAGRDFVAPSLRIPIISDPHSEVTGRVIDATGHPVEGRRVTLEAQALLAEYFRFERPLTAIPDLSDLKPLKSTLVPGLNLKNPGRVFGVDPLGLDLGSDYAARYRGEIQIGQGGGKYTFFLRSHKGARLMIDGAPVAETPQGDGDFAETSAEVAIGPGWHKIEIVYYEAVGSSWLDLTWAPPGAPRQAIPAQDLRARDESRTAVTDAAGEYRITDVPSNLEQIQVRIDAAEPVTSAPAKPSPAGVSRVGDTTIGKL